MKYHAQLHRFSSALRTKSSRLLQPSLRLPQLGILSPPLTALLLLSLPSLNLTLLPSWSSPFISFSFIWIASSFLNVPPLGYFCTFLPFGCFCLLLPPCRNSCATACSGNQLLLPPVSFSSLGQPKLVKTVSKFK